MNPGSMPGMNMGGAMGVSPEELANADPFDKAFLEAMIPHHRSAVEMSEQALDRAEHTELKGLARAIIKAQETEITQMQGWLKGWYGA